MASIVHAVPAKKVCFTKPWLIEKEDSNFMAYNPATNPVHNEDGDRKVIHKILLALSSSGLGNEPVIVEELEDKIMSDGLDLLRIVEDKIQNVIVDVLNSHKN